MKKAVYYCTLLVLMLSHGCLTASDFPIYGIYGKKWAPWVLMHPKKISLYLYQMPFSPDVDDMAEVQQIANSDEDLEILFVQSVHKSRNERWMKQAAEVDKDTKEVASHLESIYNQLDLAGSIKMTLDEENFWWNRRDKYLGLLYEDVKSRQTDIEVWQFFAEGLRTQKRKDRGNRLLIASDGYVFDEYRLPTDSYERLLEEYLGTDKPVVSILWASPGWKPQGRNERKTDLSWWNDTGWRSFYEKTMVNRKYNVPTAYFIYDIENNPKGRLIPTYDNADQCSQRFVDKLFDTTLPTLFSIDLKADAPKDRPDWIAEQCPKN